MKAAAWRKRAPLGSLALLLAGLASPSAAGASSPLPQGLPELPSLGETMMRRIAAPIALRGFDPVAYHLGDGAVPGRAEFELQLDGTVWRFASAANRAAFRTAAAIYTPRFAGLDAGAVAQGIAVDADPRIFAVIGGELFFFRSDESRAAFLADADLRLRARGAWPAVARLIAN
ncbi:YHS domain-containing (seleno)protein [Bosea sp. TWI1241]|jgi:hypothetical protein|uniref:YHS domain-containing (seleno)protein n=1 Tax=Bosea sp. TWI1241 TaxID=3148904 RepID=UPI00320947A6